MSATAVSPNAFGGPRALYDSEQAFFGRDLFFDGVLKIGPKGDYLTVDGLENYRRSILRRLVVKPGEFRLRPSYGAGLASYVKKKFTASVRAELMLVVREQVLRDRRTDKVLALDISKDESSGAIVVTLTVQIRGRQYTPRPFRITENGAT